LQKTWNGVIAPAFQFWLTNFGVWVPLVLALIGWCCWRAWKAGWRWGNKPPEDIAFLLPAIAIFIFGFLVQTAPWAWVNLKLIIWPYFLVLLILWTEPIAWRRFPVRVGADGAFFGSGISVGGAKKRPITLRASSHGKRWHR